MRLALPTLLFGILALASPAVGATCTPTGLYRDGINLTASLVNPDKATGTLDATGCHIGVYFGPGVSGLVTRAEVFGATYFGIVADAGFGSVEVTITDSWVHHIGDSPFNGSQHGVGIYYAAMEPGSRAKGHVARNTIERYQKGGIVANGSGATVDITDNTIIGLGPVSVIAQNGIQVGFGADATVMRNRVWGNAFTGQSTVSSGILVVGGPYYGLPYTTGTRIIGNIVAENDIGIYVSNLTEEAVAPAIGTNVRVVNNAISKASLTNHYAGFGYQAGISDVGNRDKFVDNTISGDGYDPNAYQAAYVVATDVDPSFTARPRIQANKN
jgi:hypothetical protein